MKHNSAAKKNRDYRRGKRHPLLCLLLAAVLLALVAAAASAAWQKGRRMSYPLKYWDEVEHWAAVYEMDPLLVEAFIRTESGFDPAAESSVGARGLMQITEQTFAWIKSKIAADEDISFDAMYDGPTNIRFGAYYVSACLSRYDGDVKTAAAAYHSGWTTVSTLLKTEAYSRNGRTLDAFPYTQMQNYVSKIAKCYQKYQELYGSENME